MSRPGVHCTANSSNSKCRLFGIVCGGVAVLAALLIALKRGASSVMTNEPPRHYWSTIVGLERDHQEGEEELAEWLAPLRHPKLLGVRRVSRGSSLASSLQLELPETMYAEGTFA